MVEVSEIDTRRTPQIPYREMEESHELSHIEHPEHDELLTLNIGRTTRPRTACCGC